ncbi:MAG: MFS transporter [Clostridiales bacterium]|nr:MFS transporter [Clostridiales bacterium]
MNKAKRLAGNAFRASLAAGKRMFSTEHKLAGILAGEGVLFTLILTLCNNNNNLFASRLGATSYQLGMISSLPPIVGMVCLIPFAIITDRMKYKKKMVMGAALLLGVMYFLVGWVPVFSDDPVALLIVLLVMVNFPLSLYSSSWQSFFSDITLPQNRNDIYAHRTKMNTAVSVVFPLIFGLILTAASGSAKIVVHQVYYLLALPLAFGQAWLLRKISFDPTPKPGRFRVVEFLRTAGSTFRSRAFLGFLAVAFLVYSGWQLDWSVYFLAQFKYLLLTEAQMSLVAVLSAATQFLMLGVWSRMASRRGVRFVFIVGVGGFAFCSFVMLFSLIMPLSVGVIFYFVFHCIGASAYSAFQFTLLLCLLEVIPNQNKTLTIAIYSTLILVSNAVMPFLGVHVYNMLGENKTAIVATIGMVALVRVFATLAAYARWKRNKGKETLINED